MEVIHLIKILNLNREPVAICENAYGIGYSKKLNEIWTASFSLPLNDPKNEECQPLNYVEIIHDRTGEYIGLFRIIPTLTTKDDSKNEVTYKLEHVLATLLDDVLFKYHQTTNLTTIDNIQYILDQQTTKNWQLGQCDFTRYFAYKYENENGLVGPLFSVATPFDEQYQWDWDTISYPWTLNLIKPEMEASCEIRYAKNIKGIEREINPSDIVNRIYPLGYGEGDNQLTIEKVNPSDNPYLENTESIAQYGLKSYVWADTRFEDADILMASAQALLDQWSVPKVTYRTTAGDLYIITGEDIDKLRMGRVVRMIDHDFGTIEERIVSEGKNDLYGDPGAIDLEIGNKSEDLGTTQADLQRRQQVNEVYSQGATNIDSYSYNDNADQNNPALIRFYVPEELVRVNKMVLNYETSEFRAYSKATKGGGATVQSTSSGGGVAKSTDSGGGSAQTSSSGGGTTETSSSYIEQHLMSGVPSNAVGTDNYGNHLHEVVVPGHNHTVDIPNHTHSVSIPNHSHSFDIPNHTHSVTIPTHTHDIDYGIFKISNTPASVEIKVDGNIVPFTSTSGDSIDIIPYLSKDSEGKIERGSWHEVSIKPNDLGRINANIFTQLFLQSRGGGNF